MDGRDAAVHGLQVKEWFVARSSFAVGAVGGGYWQWSMLLFLAPAIASTFPGTLLNFPSCRSAFEIRIRVGAPNPVEAFVAGIKKGWAVKTVGGKDVSILGLPQSLFRMPRGPGKESLGRPVRSLAGTSGTSWTCLSRVPKGRKVLCASEGFVLKDLLPLR